MVPVWVTIPEDVPARERFQIVFDWESMGELQMLEANQLLVEVKTRPSVGYYRSRRANLSGGSRSRIKFDN